jgi:potassium voltage-gated channel Shaw-related subfamily C protein 1
MTYTTHRNTQETLQILDRLDLDGDRAASDNELTFNQALDGDFSGDQQRNGIMRAWRRNKSLIWKLFDEPYSSTYAKVAPLALMT